MLKLFLVCKEGGKSGSTVHVQFRINLIVKILKDPNTFPFQNLFQQTYLQFTLYVDKAVAQGTVGFPLIKILGLMSNEWPKNVS
jgi:hypothetical protein